MPRTRQMTSAAANRWPPSSTEDDGKELVLAEEIYWEHVRPFIRSRDLKFLSRRCSTRFAPAAWQRREIGEVCSTEFIWKGRKWQILASSNKSRGRKRRRRGLNSVSWNLSKDPGSPEFMFGLTSRLEMNAADCAPAYAEARLKWDAHMAATPSPSGRLVESINMVVMAKGCGYCGGTSLPRLFLALFPDYDGSIASVIKHHKRTNPASLSGSLLYGEDCRWIHGICSKITDPRMTVTGILCCVTVYCALATPLGYYVGHWFDTWAFINEGHEYPGVFDAIESLLDAGADASCFARCLKDLDVVTWQERPYRFNRIAKRSLTQFYMFEFDINKNWFCGRRRGDVPLLRLMEQAAEIFAQSPQYQVGQAIHKVYNKLAKNIDPALLESQGLDTSLPEIPTPTTVIYQFGEVMSQPADPGFFQIYAAD